MSTRCGVASKVTNQATLKYGMERRTGYGKKIKGLSAVYGRTENR